MKRHGKLLEMTLWRLFNNFLTHGFSLKHGTWVQSPWLQNLLTLIIQVTSDRSLVSQRDIVAGRNILLNIILCQLPLGILWVKYLGVPLSSKRMSTADCDILVDKMAERIRIWHAKHLTHAIRHQLVNAVLISISSYWCQMFILPKKNLKEIMSCLLVAQKG